MNTLSSLLRILFRVAVAVASAIAVALVLAIVLVAIPLTRNFIISILAGSMLSGHLESLAVDLDIQPNLRRMFTLVVSLPIGFGIMQMIAARSFSKAWRGLAVALGTVLTLAVTVWWHTRHFNFDSNGNPIVYVSFDRDGVRKSYSDGIDRVTGRPKYQITVERVAWLSKLAQQEVREVDPATDRNWFDPNSGEPNFWYVQTCTNQWQFFNRPMFHPQLRVMASPVTPELMGQWSIEHQRLEAIKEAVRRREEVERKAAADRAENEKRIRAEQARLAFERHKAELAAAEAERQRKETEAKAAAEAERKRQEAEAEARRLAEEKARQQDAERLRQQEVVARMIRESSLAPSDLEALDFGQALLRLCPGLTVESYRPDVFTNDFYLRRFRWSCKIHAFSRSRSEARFEPFSAGSVHVVAIAVIKTDSPKPPRGGQTISMAGTIVGIHFATAPTNGIEGTLCTIDFGNAEVVAQPSSKEPEHSTVVTSSMPPQTTYKVVETVTTSEPRAAYIETYTPPATSGYVSADGYWSPTPMISTYGYGQPSGYYRAPTPVYQYRYQSQSGYRCVPQAQRAPVYSSGGHYHSHR